MPLAYSSLLLQLSSALGRLHFLMVLTATIAAAAVGCRGGARGIPPPGLRPNAASTVVRYNAPSVGLVEIVPRRAGETNRERRYVIRTVLPELKSPSSARVRDVLRRWVDDVAAREISRFKGDLWDRQPATCSCPDPDLGNQCPCWHEYAMGFDTFPNRTHVLSTRLRSAFYTGGAHPSDWATSVNLDLRTGEPVWLSDLFDRRMDYLKVLSDLATEELLARGMEYTDEEWIRRGAGPSEENFSVFNLTPDHLLLTFQRYQVAAGAAGQTEVPTRTRS